MKYQIRFTEGELVGKAFPIGADALSIGRSHSNTVQLKTPDVSGKHVNVTIGSQGVILENFSSRITTVDGAPVAFGERKHIFAGQIIGLGTMVKLTLDVVADSHSAAAGDDDATVAPGASPMTSDNDVTMPPPSASEQADDDVTVPPPAQKSVPTAPSRPAPAAPSRPAPAAPPRPAPAASPRPAPAAPPRPAPAAPPRPAPAAPPRPAPAAPPRPAPAAPPRPVPSAASSGANEVGMETIAMQTRMASAEELEAMKGSHSKKVIRKNIIIFSALVIFILMCIGIYYAAFYRKPERYISWPMDEAGNELSATVQFEGCPFSKDIDLKFPDVSGTNVKQEAGRVTVDTFLGKYRDVPLRLTVEYFQDKNTLSANRETSLQAWMAKKTGGTENWNFDLVQPLAFYQYAHGVPYICVPYSRTEDNESYVGYAVQIRNADWSFILMKEVPTRERWRAEWYIQQVCFFRFSTYFLMRHWEGTSEIQEGDMSVIINEAKSLLHRKTPTLWNKAEFLLRSVLCQAKKDGKSNKEIEPVVLLLRELRENQVEYYNLQKVSYLLAKGQKNTKESAKIIRDLKAVFSSPEDYRFHKIRHNKWD